MVVGNVETDDVIFVNRNFFDQSGGTQRQVAALRDALVARGLKVAVWAVGSGAAEFTSQGVRAFSHLRELRGELLRSRASRIVIFGSSRRDYVLAGFLARQGKPVMFSEEAEPRHVITRWGSPFPRGPLVAERERLHFLSLVPELRFIRQDIVASLPASLKERSVVVPNFVDLPATDHLVDKPEDAFVVVGCDRRWKNVDAVVRAHCRRLEEGSRWKLLLYGNYLSLSWKTRRMMRPDRQVFCGHENDRAKVHLSGRVLVIGSHSEGLSTVALEAVALGRPVIGFKDCVGVAEVVADGVNGLLVDATDSDEGALANAMRQLEEDKELFVQLSHNGESLPARFGEEYAVSQWERICLSPPPRPANLTDIIGLNRLAQPLGLLCGVVNVLSPFHGLRLLPAAFWSRSSH